MWTEKQFIYLAGIIDGEGTFYISPAPHFRHRILVVNTDERIIRWLVNNFGGLVYKRSSKKHPEWKLKYEWIVVKADIIPICKGLLPFLTSKKEQAELMIKLRESFANIHGRNKQVPEDIYKFRCECKDKITQLNHRIPLPL